MRDSTAHVSEGTSLWEKVAVVVGQDKLADVSFETTLVGPRCGVLFLGKGDTRPYSLPVQEPLLKHNRQLHPLAKRNTQAHRSLFPVFPLVRVFVSSPISPFCLAVLYRSFFAFCIFTFYPFTIVPTLPRLFVAAQFSMLRASLIRRA